MDIGELVEISLANVGADEIEVAALEPAEVAKSAVSGLAQLIAELVDNALAFSEPGEVIRLTGLFQQGEYLISISDHGVGIPGPLLEELNVLLSESAPAPGGEPRMGIALVARLAARLGISVRLVPGVPGTTARVTVPAALVSPPAQPTAPAAGHRLPARDEEGMKASTPLRDVFSPGPAGETTLDLTRFEHGSQTGTGVVAMSQEAREEAERFLDRVFAPLVKRPGMTERPAPKSPSNGNGRAARPEARPSGRSATAGTVTPLRTRVPGQNFSLVEDEPSTVAAEKAIDIRSALSRYEQGRRRAQDDPGAG